MRAVFVNYAHPDTPHVSAMRIRYFAEAMAQRGHQVLLVTSTLNEHEISKDKEQVRKELEMHDGSRPFHLACSPVWRWSLRKVRNKNTHPFVRKALVAYNYLCRGGVFSDWTAGSKAYWPVIADTFSPDITWGTFGSIDSWVIARGIARESKCPWVMDAKDRWESFIPPLLRKLLARRFRDTGGLTTNSEFLAREFGHWFSRDGEVVYSGVNEVWTAATSEPQEGFRVMLVGCTYCPQTLARFVSGFRDWLESLDQAIRMRVSFCYAGCSAENVRLATGGLRNLCTVDIQPYLPLPELAKKCREAAANVYMWYDKTFHHKLVELLCCRRPIVCFPGEREESINLAASVGGNLLVCRDETDIVRVFSGILMGKFVSEVNSTRLESLTWASQAGRLEAYFELVKRNGKV